MFRVITVRGSIETLAKNTNAVLEDLDYAADRCFKKAKEEREKDPIRSGIILTAFPELHIISIQTTVTGNTYLNTIVLNVAEKIWKEYIQDV